MNCRLPIANCRMNRASQSEIGNRKSAIRAFTLIEMLTTVALLVIVLGLMVSLARYVRTRSATQLTRELLVNLNEAIARYESTYAGVPPVDALAEPGELPAEDVLL